MKFKVIDFDEIYSICKNPLKMESLSEYLNGGRQDVLINPDIFCENVRSIDKIYQRRTLHFLKELIILMNRLLLFSQYI